MPARRRNLDPDEIEGLEYFDALVPLLARLKLYSAGSARGK